MILRLSIHFLLLSCLLVRSFPSEESLSTRNQAEIDFQRDIRPILSANSFQCHGPDENTREAELRLNLAEPAFQDRGGYSVLFPSNSRRSELLRRALAEDHDELMPLVESGKSLTSEQIELLERWIDSGATYQQHWAFVAPSRAIKRVLGRDHHPQAFTMWLAGGGGKTGTTLGSTDDLGFHVVEDPVHVHDLLATILHLLGLNHEKLTFQYQEDLSGLPRSTERLLRVLSHEAEPTRRPLLILKNEQIL